MLGRVWARAEGSAGRSVAGRAVFCVWVSSLAGLEQADKMLFFSQCTP